MNLFESPELEKQAKSLFLVASDAVSELISYSGKLEKRGICEAIMFNSNLILNEPKLRLKHNFSDIEDGYLTLLFFLIQRERPEKTTEELFSFIDERLSFYSEEYNKLMNKDKYLPMWVYSTFYLVPLEDEPKPCLDVFEILSFQLGLFAMVEKVKELLNIEIQKI